MATRAWIVDGLDVALDVARVGATLYCTAALCARTHDADVDAYVDCTGLSRRLYVWKSAARVEYAPLSTVQQCHVPATTVGRGRVRALALGLVFCVLR